MGKRRGRTILTLLSIVIGVAAIVSVRLATATTRGTYTQMFSSMSGRASLQIASVTGVVFPETILEEVRGVVGVETAAPIIRRTATLFFENVSGEEGEKRKARVSILGIVPEMEQQVRETKLIDGRLFEGKNEVGLGRIIFQQLWPNGRR